MPATPEGGGRWASGDQIAAAIDSLKASYEAAEQQRSKHDLKGLKWTRAAVGAAIAYTVLTAALLGAGVYSAFEARNAVDAANRAVAAATRQGAIAEDTEKRQLRAYVAVFISEGNHENTFQPPATPAVHFDVRNSGITPAYETTHLSGVNMCDYPLPKNFNFTTPDPPTPPTPMTVFSGVNNVGMTITSKRRLTSDEYQGIANGKRRVCFWGTVRYADAFNEIHFTNFCNYFYGTANTIINEACEQHNDSN